MIAYLDTCTILNLLQVNYDDVYLKCITKSFDEIKLTPLVFEELRVNKYVNIIDNSNKEILDNIIYEQLQMYVDREDYSDSLDFTRTKNTHCFKENGESHSVSYSVKLSRYGHTDLGENLLQTHFISDDTPARESFSHFYHINVIGQILNSIDLMTIFWLKQYITKSELIKYCNSLKQLYSKDVGIMLIKLKDYSHDFADDLKGKEKIMLTKLIEELSDIKHNTNDLINEIIVNPDFKGLLKRNSGWKDLLTNILKSKFREKIPYINNRIQDFEKVYS